MVGSGYKNDPYVLFLEEIKDWLTKTISFVECTRDTREMLQQRVRKLFNDFSNGGIQSV